MDEHVLNQIVGRDKAVAAKIIENFTTAHTSLSSGALKAGGAGVSGRSTDSRSLITRTCSLVLSVTVTTSPVRSSTMPNLSKCRPLKKYFFVTVAHEPVFLAFIVLGQLAFTDVYFTVYFLLLCIVLRDGTRGTQRHKIADHPINRSRTMMRFKAQEKGEKRAIT